MQQKILPPTQVVYKEENASKGVVEIQGCYLGYGSTLGNALRRVLLSSLEGAAITSVKIAGVQHEYSTIPGVMEDVVQILLNLKRLRFTVHTDEPVTVSLNAKGEKVVTAGMIESNTDAEVVDKDHVIATISDKNTSLEMELTVERGIGYVSVENQVREDVEIGTIAIDAIYTPVRRVNYEVDNMRVGKRTDYEKVTLDIETDGSITPKEAFDRAVVILVEQFSSLSALTHKEATDAEDESKDAETEA